MYLQNTTSYIIWRVCSVNRMFILWYDMVWSGLIKALLITLEGQVPLIGTLFSSPNGPPVRIVRRRSDTMHTGYISKRLLKSVHHPERARIIKEISGDVCDDR